MATFEDFTNTFLDGAKELAREIFGNFEAEAREDAQAFLDKAKEDLQRWTKLLLDGQLTEQDFSDLLHAKKALAEIHALRQAGVSLTKLERFRTRLINLAIDTAFDTFL